MRGVPKAVATKEVSKGAFGRGNDLGYGKNVTDATMDNPQPSPKSKKLSPGWVIFDMDAVQRLNGGGFRGEHELCTFPGA